MESGAVVQSIIFDKNFNTPEEAKTFLKRIKYKFGKLDETEDFYRFRQIDPNILRDAKHDRFRTITIDEKNNIKMILAYPRTIRGGLLGAPKIRRDFKPSIRSLLEKIGNKEIISITLQRNPIETVLKSMLDVLTLGRFSEQTKKLGYDKIFHLSAIIQLKDYPKPITVEKNEVINISEIPVPLKKNGERLNVPINKKITLNEMLDNSIKNLGSKFFLYDAFTNNCQMFLRDLLKFSGLLTSNINTWIMQDAKKIAEGLPFWSSRVFKEITNAGAWFDRVIYGRGKVV